MINLNKTNESIPKVLIGLNIIFLLVGIFVANKALLISLSLLNLILVATYLIIQKFGFLFTAISATNRFAKKLNSGLDNLNLN